MTTMNPQPLQARPYIGAPPIPINVISVDEFAGFNGVREECLGGGAREDRKSSAIVVSRTSELAISFEGEVYVFPSVTPEKVQAVLLLLGGYDIPSCSPNSKLLLQQNIAEVGDPSQVSKHSRRIASLLRFREKKKERCFEKKVRYSCRKEVAQRMHRKNGQFVASKDSSNIDTRSLDSSDGTPSAESVPSHCQHCGTNERCTPAMRRGPGGPRSLCNACGLMWANKGALRDLTKIGRAISSDQIEVETSADLKPSVTEPENSYHSDDEEESPEEIKTVTVNFDSSSLNLCDQVMQLTDDVVTDQVQNSLLDLDDQDTLDELANASGPEFDIPDNIEDQMSVFSGLT